MSRNRKGSRPGPPTQSRTKSAGSGHTHAKTQAGQAESLKDHSESQVTDQDLATDLGDPDSVETKKSEVRTGVILAIVLALIIGVLSLPLFLPKGPVDTSCLDNRFANFFTMEAATEEEVATQIRYEDHVTNLGGYICSQGVHLGDHQDPVSGYWESDEGYFTFSDNRFRWSVELEDDPGEYYFEGAYTWIPGCEWEDAYELNRSTFPCYTVFLRYETTMNNDVLSDDLYYGGFMVAVEDPQSISAYNMRSGGAFYLNRPE